MPGNSSEDWTSPQLYSCPSPNNCQYRVFFSSLIPVTKLVTMDPQNAAFLWSVNIRSIYDLQRISIRFLVLLMHYRQAELIKESADLFPLYIDLRLLVFEKIEHLEFMVRRNLSISRVLNSNLLDLVHDLKVSPKLLTSIINEIQDFDRSSLNFFDCCSYDLHQPNHLTPLQFSL